MGFFPMKGGFYCNQLGGGELRLRSVGVGCTHTSASRALGVKQICALNSLVQITEKPEDGSGNHVKVLNHFQTVLPMCASHHSSS